MKLGTRREIAAAKTVAQARELPRPIKELVIAYHEDEKGKKTVPMIVRRFWVVGGLDEKLCVHVDAQGQTHRFPIARGELDFTSPALTVQDVEYDSDGEILAITPISHETQYKLNTSKTNWDTKAYAFMRGPRTPPLTHICRFNVAGKKRANILSQWQAQADSPEATWIDGKEPSLEQMTRLQAEWDKRGEKKADAEAVGARSGPTDPDEIPGEDFST